MTEKLKTILGLSQSKSHRGITYRYARERINFAEDDEQPRYGRWMPYFDIGEHIANTLTTALKNTRKDISSYLVNKNERINLIVDPVDSDDQLEPYEGPYGDTEYGTELYQIAITYQTRKGLRCSTQRRTHKRPSDCIEFEEHADIEALKKRLQARYNNKEDFAYIDRTIFEKPGIYIRCRDQELMHSFQNPAYTLFKDAFQNLFKNLDTNKILKSLFTFRYGATDHNRPTGSVFHSSEIYELTVNKHALGTGSILVDYADNIDSYFEHQELQASRSCAEDGDPTFGILEDTSPTEQKILAFKTYKEHLDASPQEFEPDLSFNQDFLSLKR